MDPYSIWQRGELKFSERRPIGWSVTVDQITISKDLKMFRQMTKIPIRSDSRNGKKGIGT